MKVLIGLLIGLVLLAGGCKGKKTETPPEHMPANPHAGMKMPPGMLENPHGTTSENGALDLESLLSNLPEGWTKSDPTSTMRLAQITLAAPKGETENGELAIFHFPGSGGTSAENILRWQNQFSGPNGEPGPSIAKTDTMMAGLLTVITTDVTGKQLAGGAMMGGGQERSGMRMMASVVETPSGGWFFKAVGPAKTIAAHQTKIREFLKRAKLKDAARS
jgi:hypothetical protein